jgi:hypothetical protein
VAETAKKQIPRAKSGPFGMTTCLAERGHYIVQSSIDREAVPSEFVEKVVISGTARNLLLLKLRGKETPHA